MLIGLYSSRPQSGKSTVASLLTERHDFDVIPFAGTLKEMFRVLLLDLGLSEGESERALFFDKERPLDCLQGKTPRHALQTLGTEWGRQCLDPGIWVRAWQAQVQQAWRIGQNHVVADDVRFPEEMQAVRELGGIVVRVVRGDALDGDVLAHASEGALDGEVFDELIVNDGSLEELEAAVAAMLDAVITRRLGASAFTPAAEVIVSPVLHSKVA